MLDRQPIRASEIARLRAHEWLPSELRVLLSESDVQSYNDGIAASLLAFGGYRGGMKAIRKFFPTLSSKQAKEYAVYAFAWAAEEATLERILDIGTLYKKAIVRPGCCAICQANKDQGSILPSELFSSGHMHAPFCASCRCAISGTRSR